MILNNPLTTLYTFFSYRRWILYVCTLIIVVISVAVIKGIDISEDIRSMLPDEHSGIAYDFDLLQRAPFMNKIIINLKGASTSDSKSLIEVSNLLASSMKPPFFSRVVYGPDENMDIDLIAWLLDILPNIATDKDLDIISKGLNSEGIRVQIEKSYDQLVQLEGYIFKDLIRSDPLELRSVAVDKLRFVNFMSGMHIYENHFMSNDNRNTLLIAETPISITDSSGSEELLNHFNELVDKVVPPEVTVSFISGHRYSMDNAKTIKRDLFVILPFSTLAIFAIYIIWIRSFRGIYVFLVPVFVLCLASAGVSIFYQSVSAITIGFGSVLLGISIDFALHVYFALRGKNLDQGVVIGEVSRPVLLGGLTTIFAFSILLFSDLPGQRQLAVFSIIGIIVSLIFSLVVLPHLLKSQKEKICTGEFSGSFSYPKIIILIWILALLFCIYHARKLDFDGGLRSLNKVTEELRNAEDEIGQTWGNFRASAMVFTKGKDLQSALERNDRLFECLNRVPNIGKIVSLAPILPSKKTQKANQEHWRSFWSNKRKERVRRILLKEGTAFGFSQKAFEPFFDSLFQQTLLIYPDDLRAVGLGDLLDSMILKRDEHIQVITLVSDTPAVLSAVTNQCEKSYDIRLISQMRFGELVGEAIAIDFSNFIIKASALVILLLGLLFRDG